MKTNRNGQSKVLTTAELDLLIEELPGGVHTVLANVCRRTGCRISEARQLKWENIFPTGITFPKQIVKNKLWVKDINQDLPHCIQLKPNPLQNGFSLLRCTTYNRNQ